MCNQITLIASTTTPLRYIARCEHGTLHVVWNNAAYYLNRQGLVELRERLVGTGPANQIHSPNSGQAGTPWIELWFQNAGVRVQPEELETLRVLVEDALWFLDHETIAAESPPVQNTLLSAGVQPNAARQARWN